ncbi:hypothetical protein SAMN05444002_0392 [Vannielia litorea]|uniref:Nucleotide-diphospho-sugar transferase domain-containing protein n=2 Tax=Vannielia litorea TaxID=1217970 RepID=A0A1N6E6V9_9RHOB|nr:hypothetical protein SAMN05444002_0392 [Vannielia litorea]
MHATDTKRPPSEGFVFAVSGAAYVPLALRAAESLRLHHPDHPIDLFCDQPVTAEIFTQVIPLENSWFRPKFEAMQRSRFDRTILLDADVLCIAPMNDVFSVLDRFDLAAAHEPRRNSKVAVSNLAEPLPAAFPQLNTGVLAFCKDPRVSALAERVVTTLQTSGLDRDQPVFRACVYESDLRLWVLPDEYNFMTIELLEAYTEQFAAPRILHLPRLHRHVETINRKRKFSRIKTILGPPVYHQLEALLAADRTLGGSGAEVKPLIRRGLPGLARALSRGLSKRLNQWISRD